MSLKKVGIIVGACILGLPVMVVFVALSGGGKPIKLPPPPPLERVEYGECQALPDLSKLNARDLVALHGLKCEKAKLDLAHEGLDSWVADCQSQSVLVRREIIRRGLSVADMPVDCWGKFKVDPFVGK